MGVDEPEQAVKLYKRALFYYLFKFFYGAFALLYVQEFVKVLFFAKHLEHALVHESGEQVEPGQV